MTQHGHIRRRRLAALALAGGVLLSLSGCLRMHMTLEVGSDDTVDGTVVFAVQDSVLALMGDEANGIFDQNDFGSDEGVTVGDYAQDGYTGKTYTFSGTPISDFSDDDLRLTREGDEFVLDGSMDMTQLGGDQAEGLADSFDMRISFTFPGDVIDANGEIDGTTVTWVPVAGEQNPLTARAGASPASSLPLGAVIGIAVAAVALLAALFLVLNRRRQEPVPAADEPVAPGGSPVPDDAPAPESPATTPDPEQPDPEQPAPDEEPPTA